MCPTEADKKVFLQTLKTQMLVHHSKQNSASPPPLESGWGAALADGNMTESFTLPARQSGSIEHWFPQLNKKRTATTILSEVRMRGHGHDLSFYIFHTFPL